MSRRKKDDGWGMPEDTLQEQRADLSMPEAAPHRAKKNTRKWCKGRVGREHVRDIRLDRWGVYRRQCDAEAPCRWRRKGGSWRWELYQGHPRRAEYTESNEFFWSCCHEPYCSVCGKVLGWSLNGLSNKCPDYKERT